MDQLKPYTLRKLIVDVICAMIRDNYLDDRPEDFYSFLLGGKEPLYTFLDLCKSTKTLLLESDSMTAYFDKEVCLTEEDVILHCGPKGFKHFLIKNLLKHTRRLICNQYFLTDTPFSIVPFLADMQNLEELVFLTTLEGTRTLFNNLKSVKSIEAELSIFKLMDSVVENYRMEKMIARYLSYPPMAENFGTTFTNLCPVELHFRDFPVVSLLSMLNKLQASSSITSARKMVFSPAVWIIGHCYKSAGSTFGFIDLIQQKFPFLEELVINHSFKLSDNPWGDMYCIRTNMSALKKAIYYCEEMFMHYHGNLKLYLSWKSKRAYVYSRDLPRFLARMQRTFPTYNYSVKNANNNPTHHWKTVSVFSTNAIFDVDISFSEIQRFPRNLPVSEY